MYLLRFEVEGFVIFSKIAMQEKYACIHVYF
jgi:hypothetical protein